MESEKYVIKYIIRYSEYEKLVNSLIKKIKKSKKEFDIVCGIPRGGLCLAVELSHKLNIPFWDITEEDGSLKNFLMVDDLVDTGKTLIEKTEECKEFIKHYKGYEPIITTAVLFKKPWAKFEPDFYVEETDKWVVFPYENPNEEIPEDYKTIPKM